MNLYKKLTLFVISTIGLLMIFIGVFTGDILLYATGSLAILSVTIYTFVFISNQNISLLLIITIFLFLRYIPIFKFNQPLFGDAVFDLETAQTFEENGRFEILGRYMTPFFGNDRMQKYSSFPLLHLMTVTIHYFSGYSLFDVFTYFAPIIGLSSILFLYLLTKHIFNDEKIGAMSGLMLATFSAIMHWQTLMVRQNIAYTLALMALYLYVKGRVNRNIKIFLLSIFVFITLPIAHHLTQMEILLIISFSVIIKWLLKSDFLKYISMKTYNSISYQMESTYLFTFSICLFIGVSTFLWWTTYSSGVILRMFAEKPVEFISGLFFEREPGFTRIVRRIGNVIDIFDILSFLRMFFYAIATLWGFLMLKKWTNIKIFLYSFFIVPFSLITMQIFFQRNADLRHLLFLMIPMFIVTANIMRTWRKEILAICLFVILIPAPFKLDKTLLGAPTYIYDRTSSYTFSLGEKVDFRNDQALVSASFIAEHTNKRVVTDFYIGTAFLFYSEAEKAMHFLSTKKGLQNEYVFLMQKEYVDLHELVHFYDDSEVVKYISNMHDLTSCIYDNSEVKGWLIRKSQ